MGLSEAQYSGPFSSFLPLGKLLLSLVPLTCLSVVSPIHGQPHTVNCWGAWLLQMATCTGTPCHLPLGPPPLATIMRKEKLWGTVHRMSSVLSLAMVLTSKQRQSEAQPLPYLRSCPVLGPSCLLRHGSPASPSSVLWRSWSLESTESQSRVTGFCFDQINLNSWTFPD